MRKLRATSLLIAACALIGALARQSDALEPAPITLNVMGGLGGIRQYTAFEEPFWSKELSEISGGRVKATIHPFDRSGVQGQDMLQLIRLGVAPFGTAIVSMVAVDEPLLGAIDLPGLSPDVDALKKNLATLRPRMAELLRERYSMELLAVYAHSAQVVFCAKPFASIQDLWGRRVRTSSVAQSEMLSALGAVPVILPFADMPAALEKGVVDCAVTGSLGGFEIGLPRVTSHVHAMALGWGISIFGANVNAWQALPEHARATVSKGVADLEARIWASVERDTYVGLQCNAGEISCGRDTGRRLGIVPIQPSDEALRRQVLEKYVVTAWIDRCGSACEQVWTELLAPAQDATAASIQAAGAIAPASKE